MLVGILGGDLEGCVGRAVIDNDQLPIVKILGENRIQRLPDQRGSIVCGSDDRKERHGERVNSLYPTARSSPSIGGSLQNGGCSANLWRGRARGDTHPQHKKN